MLVFFVNTKVVGIKTFSAKKPRMYDVRKQKPWVRIFTKFFCFNAKKNEEYKSRSE